VSATRVVIFAKAPVAGLAKTRLIPLLGAEGAARLAADMLEATVAHAIDAGHGQPLLCVTPDRDDPAWLGLVPAGVAVCNQGPGDLGQRMSAAARRLIEAGERVVLIGTDCPALDGAALSAAAARLDTHDAVIIPAEDGGYVLLGLKRFHPSLFADLAWSTDQVAGETMARIAALGWSLFVGEPLRDVDEPGDLGLVGW